MQIITDYALEKVDSSGYRFMYDGFSDYMTIENIIKPDKKKLELFIQQFTLKTHILLDELKIFVFPYRLRVFDKSWQIESYKARAYTDHIIIGASTENDFNSNLLHEIGHIFQKKYIPDLYKYKQLRNIPSDWTDNSVYDKRPQEIFARDFSYFFSQDLGIVNNSLYLFEELPNPSTNIKEYILDFIPNIDEIVLQIGSKKIVHNGILGEMDVEVFTKNSRTYVPIRFVVEKLGCLIFYDDKTQQVIILKEK